jgi:hypothetical protein
MKKSLIIFTVFSLCLISSVVLVAEVQRSQGQGGGRPAMSFFVTSKGSGDGGNLMGIAGGDYMCQTLAEAAGSTKTWHAYLSTRAGDNATTLMHPRERIGTGPWYNAKGELVAKNLEELHGKNNNLNRQTALTEKGEMPSSHEIVTGSRPDGMGYPRDNADHTCYNWTSNKDTGSVQVGDLDQTGESSWNSAHATKGCSQKDLATSGGAGLFYCFAID